MMGSRGLQPNLVILDPLNPENNIGRASYNFEEVRKAFSKAFQCITE
jgi:DNA polymerase sigma